MNVIPVMLKDDYDELCTKPDWVIESSECIKDASKHLMNVKSLVEEGLTCKEKGITIGGEGGVFQRNIPEIKTGLKTALLDIAIFADQFGKRENKKSPESSGVLAKIGWKSLKCNSIEDDALIRLAKYMRNYFSHIRSGRQDFTIIASYEVNDDSVPWDNWASSKYYKIDIQKMVKNKDIRVPKGIGINDFAELLTDKKYTDLRGYLTGKAYIDVGKFATEMISRLHSIWGGFVSDNEVEWQKLRVDLSKCPVMQSKLNNLNKALDIENLKKLGWHNINGEYFPSKYEMNK
ncbi:MAG: hypothetical protein FWC69_03765 [Defluviitaleaceae bacterium]|nr:hypothetical protein [Defluviitaleaceae bacterium]